MIRHQTLLGQTTAVRSRADLLADQLGDRITAESLAPGALVGTLEEIREETGFARATVSEAVRLLRDRGVIEIRPGRGGGLFVADGGPLVRLRRTLLSIQEEPGAVLDAIELREHLELFIDLHAARSRTRRDVADLRKRVVRMGAAPDWAEFMRCNWALHERIALIGSNAMARGVYIGTLGHLTASTTTMTSADSEASSAYRQERYQVHADLVEAIADGDEDRVHDAVARHNLSG